MVQSWLQFVISLASSQALLGGKSLVDVSLWKCFHSWTPPLDAFYSDFHSALSSEMAGSYRRVFLCSVLSLPGGVKDPVMQRGKEGILIIDLTGPQGLARPAEHSVRCSTWQAEVELA